MKDAMVKERKRWKYLCYCVFKIRVLNHFYFNTSKNLNADYLKTTGFNAKKFIEVSSWNCSTFEGKREFSNLLKHSRNWGKYLSKCQNLRKIKPLNAGNRVEYITVLQQQSVHIICIQIFSLKWKLSGWYVILHIFIENLGNLKVNFERCLLKSL